MKLNEYDFKYEYENIEYPFLNIPQTKYKNTHYEVSSYSISIIYNHFKYFNGQTYKKNGFLFIDEAKRRRLITSPGAYIKHPKGKFDIVADILTTTKRSKFKDFFKVNNDDTNKFKQIYHSIGNIIPCPEGSNAGQKGQDDYFNKLTYIKSLLDGKIAITDAEERAVKTRFEMNIPFGSIQKKAFEENIELYKNIIFKDNIVKRYWLKSEGGNKINWKKYVKYNHLQDFVDSNYKIIEAKNINELINMIIKRGYRIFNNGEKITKEELKKAYDSIKIK